MLYFNGCSWVFGGELESPKTFAFPYIIGDRVKKTVINNAIEGQSNESIFRNSLYDISMFKDELEFVCIGWTIPWRSEVLRRKKCDCIGVHNHSLYDWMQLTAHSHTPMFRKMLSLISIRHLLIKQLQWSISLASICENFNIPYFFFNIVKREQRAAGNKKGQYITTNLVKTGDLPEYWKTKFEKHYPSFLSDSACWNEFIYHRDGEYGGYKDEGHPDEKAHEMWSYYIEDIMKNEKVT
jgi:hypothetical protein